MIAVSQRRNSQRGNQLVEAAVCFLPMMALFFGLIDVCFALAIQGVLSSATRAASRWAITYPGSYNGASCTSQATCIEQVTQTNAVGFLAGTKISYVTVNYYVPNNLTTPVSSCSNGTCTPSATVTLPYTYTVYTDTGSTSETITYANQPGNIVEVTIPSYPLIWMAPMAGYSAGTQVTDINGHRGLGLTVSAATLDVLGGLPPGTAPPSP